MWPDDGSLQEEFERVRKEILRQHHVRVHTQVYKLRSITSIPGTGLLKVLKTQYGLDEVLAAETEQQDEVAQFQWLLASGSTDHFTFCEGRCDLFAKFNKAKRCEAVASGHRISLHYEMEADDY